MTDPVFSMENYGYYIPECYINFTGPKRLTARSQETLHTWGRWSISTSRSRYLRADIFPDLYDLAHHVAGWESWNLYAWSSTGILSCTCTIWILCNISERQVRIEMIYWRSWYVRRAHVIAPLQWKPRLPVLLVVSQIYTRYGLIPGYTTLGLFPNLNLFGTPR